MDFMKIHKAVAFAAEAHDGQVRKTSDIPYVTHPFTAALIIQTFLQQIDFTEEQKTNIITAVLLHDVWEDTKTELKEIKDKFGDEVMTLIKGASEADKTKSWTERKTDTINKAYEASLPLKYVICSDKIHNLISIQEGLHLSENEFWESFKKGRKEQNWYYESLYQALTNNLNPIPPVFLELKKQIDVVFG